MVMRKKGISAIVATVLIVLITVAAVAILWGAILPMFNEVDISNENAISIDTSGGYTLYDETQKIACVQVKKESSLALEGLRVLFNIEGNSFYGLIAKGDVPELNQKKTYCFSLKNFGKPSSVTVVALPEDKSIAVTSKVSVSELNVQALGSIVGDEGSPSQLRYLDGDPSLLTGCGVLNVSGRTYRLKNNVSTTGTCFTIIADNVTLDCGSWANRIVYGNVNDATEYYGIYSGKRNTNIKNCEITRGDLATTTQGRYGIYFGESNYSKIEKVNSSNNLYGVYLFKSSNNALTNIITNLNSVGIYLERSSDDTLTQIITNSNANGVYLDLSSNRNILTNVTANFNDAGFWMYSSSWNVFNDVTANSNLDVGVYSYLSRNNIFNSLTANSNTNSALYFYSDSNNNTFNNLNLWNCSSNAIKSCVFLFGSNNNTISGGKIGKSAGYLIQFQAFGWSGISNNIVRDVQLIEPYFYAIRSNSAPAGPQRNNQIINSSYVNESVETDGQLIRKWYYTAYVNDSTEAPVSGVNVTARNMVGAYQFNLTTGTDGRTGIAEIIDYINNAGIKTYSSNYNVSVVKSPYAILNQNWNVTVQQNNRQNFQFA